MYKWIIELVFVSFFLIIYADDPVILTNTYINSQARAESNLAEIQPEESLPFILFEKLTNTSDGNPFDFPETIDTVVIFNSSTMVDGISVEGKKMLGGTSFSSAYSNVPMFFCPKQNSSETSAETSSETCLAPQDFRYNHLLLCPVQPIPAVQIFHEVPCGLPYDHNTITHSMGYEICEEPGRYWQRFVRVYYFCYDFSNKKNLYTSHYILSPELLSSYLLFREQQLNYPPSGNDKVKTANEDVIKFHLQAEQSGLNAMYRVQKLVPTEDFALGTWRQTTFQYVNMEFQHRDLYDFWNKIHYLVRREAIRVNSLNIKFYVRTGVFNLSTNVIRNDGQLNNMWVKVVTSMKKTSDQTLQGLVFLMNNFVDTDNPSLINNYYCPENTCLPDFISQTGGKVLCCKMNYMIAELFGPRVINPNLKVLQIPDVN